MTVSALPLRANATFIGSTVGRKVIMAVTGVILIGFVFIHMIGNMQLYLGPEALNHYADLPAAATSARRPGMVST